MKALSALRQAAILAVIAIVPATISRAHWQATSKDLASHEVVWDDNRLPDGNTVWVDARSKSDYDAGHISEAVLLNESDWDTLLGGVFEVWQPEKSIVVYCNAGCPSSEKVAACLRDMGIEPVYFLRGGYESWKKSHPR